MHQSQRQRQPNRTPSSPVLGHHHQTAEAWLPQLAGKKGAEHLAVGGPSRSLRTAALVAELGAGVPLGGMRRVASESVLTPSRMARGPPLGPLSIVDSGPQKPARRADSRCAKVLSFATSEIDLERQWEYERKARSVMLPRVVKVVGPPQAQEPQASPPRDGRRLLDLSPAQQQPNRIASKARSEPAHSAAAMAQGPTTPGARSLGHGPSMSSARQPWNSQGQLSPVVGSPSGQDSMLLVSPAAMTSPATTGPGFALPGEEDDDEELQESPAELLWAAQLKRERLQRTPNHFQLEGRRPLARGPSDGAERAKSSGAASPELSLEDVSPLGPARRGGLRFEDRSRESSPSKQSLCLRFEEPDDDGARSPAGATLMLPAEGMEASVSPALTDASPMAVHNGAPPPEPPTPMPSATPAAPEVLGMSGAGWPPLRPSLDRARMNFISACNSPVAEQAQGAAALPDLHLRLVRAEAAYLDGRPIAEVDGESLQAAFKHFRMPHAVEIAKEELQELVQGLGLSMASAEEVRRIADIVTPYSELDFDEFLKFIDLYFKEERDQLRSLFNKFDPDKTGELTVDSLRKLMPQVGLTPMHEMMLEALNMIGTDSHGSVDFEAFVCVLVVYRHAEGFSRPEVARLCTVFKRFAEDFAQDTGRDTSGEPKLPLSEVGKALVQVFGLQVQEEANKLQSHAARLFVRRGHGAKGEKEMDFREFLIFARWLREVMLRRVAAEFARNTTSGSIGVDELSNVLRNLGYEPMRAVMSEILGEIEVETPGMLNLEEFEHFLLVFQGRDGFQLAELQEIQEVFERFDEDGSETIDVPELGMMLRHMGYYMGLDDLHLLVKEVDVNRRGSLDHPEFRRLMRLHRDGEVRRLRTIFDRYSKGQAQLTSEDVQLALQAHLKDALGEMKPETGSEPEAMGGGDSNAPRPIIARPATGGGVDFEAFTALAESHRSATVARQRRFAGFPRETVMQLKELFKKWDADSSGVIDPIEIEGLLKDLGMECRTREEQTALIAHLDAARHAAIEAGVEPKCRPGEGAICFWVLVQLMRILRTERDQSAEVREVQVVKELGFTKAEVEDFREVFLRWTRHGGKAAGIEEGKADGSPGAGGVSFASRAGSAGGGATEKDGLSRGIFYKLLLSLGVSLGYKEKEELEERFAGADLDDEGRLSFLGFLGLMRWLLDSDFAGVNAAAQETLATSTSQGNFFQKRRQSMALFNPVGGRTM